MKWGQFGRTFAFKLIVYQTLDIFQYRQEEKTRGNKIEKKLKNKEEKKKTNKKRASSCQKIKSKEPNTYSFSVVVTQWPIFFPLRLYHHNDAFAASSTLLQ